MQSPERSPQQMVQLYLPRVARPFNEERTVFSTKGVGKAGYPQAKQ